jgi:hypothetical protein
MEMYRTFRGADPDKKPMLRARGLLKEEPAVEEAEVTTEAEESSKVKTSTSDLRIEPGKAPKAPKSPVAPLKPSIKK